MGLRTFIPRVGKEPLHWLLEGLLIIISVALGFWVTELQQSRQERAQAARVLERIQIEIEQNAEVLDPYVPMHGEWLDALDAVDTALGAQSAFDVFIGTRPKLPPGVPSPFPFLRRSAWDAARTLSSARDRHAKCRAACQCVLTSPSLFDPASRRASVKLLWLTLADIQSAEVILRDAYRGQLSRMREATAD
jgi:hypothetical protein